MDNRNPVWDGYLYPYLWTDWSLEGVSTCTLGQHVASVQAVVPAKENGYCNRRWEVRRGELLIASGYTLGSHHATVLAEMALHVDGAG